MKKLLSILLVVLLSISLVGCNSPTDTNLEDDILALENRIEVLEARLDNIVVTKGLNGQVDYYENNSIQYEEHVSMSLDYMSLAKTEVDYVDKSKTPEYIWDEFGEYINIQELNNMLCMKYLDMSCNSQTGFQYKIQAYQPNGMTSSEYMVRLSMMIVELSYYDFYIIDSPQLYVEFQPGAGSYMTVRMSLLIEDKYALHPAIFWNGLMDTNIVGTSFMDTLLTPIYEQYVEDGTFDGFVLPNYK